MTTTSRIEQSAFELAETQAIAKSGSTHGWMGDPEALNYPAAPHFQHLTMMTAFVNRRVRCQ
jgi:hypothetical protein